MPEYLYDVLPDGSWQGKSCVVVGGGSSLIDFDWSRLEHRLVIGVNRAFEKCDCTIMFSGDNDFWRWHWDGSFGPAIKRRYDNYTGIKCAMNHGLQYRPGIKLVDNGGYRFWSNSLKDGVGLGANSGFAAVNVACCLKANPIYLLGFDMKASGPGGKERNWYDGYLYTQKIINVPKPVPWHHCCKYWIEYFEWAAPKIAEQGIKLINCNPDSALRRFEFGELPSG